MDRTKFITKEISKENALVRLAILEESISNLSRLIRLAQGAQKAWNAREEAYKEQMAKKLEYHEILQAEVKEQLAINGVVVPKGTFYCYKETSRNLRCPKPCMTDGKCGWNESQ